MQRWWNYAKGNWEESPLSLIEDPSLRPQAHFFRRLLNLGSSNLRDQNRGNEGKTRNAIGMLWPLQPLVSHYSKLLIVLHCKPSLKGCRWNQMDLHAHCGKEYFIDIFSLYLYLINYLPLKSS